MPGIMIDGINRPFICVDAHLDQFGPQSGGWGSAEQLQGMDQLGGALRVLFCETLDRDGNRDYPRTISDHIRAMSELRFFIMPPYMPQKDLRWHPTVQFRYHVEGLESARTRTQLRKMLAQLSGDDVGGTNPIYHPDNPLGGCSKEPGVGLTELGQWFFRALWDQGWWLDTAHMSDTSIAEVLAMHRERTNARVCYTHGGIQHDEIDHPALTDGNMERCLTMDRALEIVQAGGLVCLSPARPFYNRLDGPFLDHIRTLGEASDWHGVGIGTDYGGILDEWRLPGCLTVADCFRVVITTLLHGGIRKRHVRRIVGSNVSKFFDLRPTL